MRSSFILGLVGGVITMIMGFLVFFVATFAKAFGSTMQGLEYLPVLSFIGGIMGIVGGSIGKKVGGGLMIFGGIFALVGAGLFGILGLVLLVVGGVLAFKEGHKPIVESKEKEEKSIDVLKMRYAKGEITSEEYEQMKKDLER